MKKSKGFLILLVPFLWGCAPEEKEISFQIDEVDDIFVIHTDVQKELIDSIVPPYTDTSKLKSGHEEISYPNHLELSFDVMVDGKTTYPNEYNIKLSKKQNMSDSWDFVSSENTFELFNFEIATQYYFTISANIDGKDYVSEVQTFTTSDEVIRNLEIDGVANFRDLGGYVTEDGNHRVKQGLIYRTGRLNVSDVPGLELDITDVGSEWMLDRLGIKSEIDLRTTELHAKEIEGVTLNVSETSGITESPLGNDVTYLSKPMEWNGVSNLLTHTENVEKIKDIINFIGNSNNLPTFFHCNIGTDRTGIIAFLINGMLGVSLQNLYRDYLFSNLGKISSGTSTDPARTLNNITSYVSTLTNYTGDTLKDKITNYLTNVIGIESSVIKSIQNTMLEEI